MKQLTQGAQDALGIVAGKAIARMVPTMIPQLPKTGVMGLGIQAAAAVLTGYAADLLKLPRDVSRMLLAGGLSAPLETAAVAYRVPILGPALDPVAQAGAVASLSGFRGRRLGAGRRMGAYANQGAGGQQQLGAYANPNGGGGAQGGWQPWMG